MILRDVDAVVGEIRAALGNELLTLWEMANEDLAPFDLARPHVEARHGEVRPDVRRARDPEPRPVGPHQERASEVEGRRRGGRGDLRAAATA